MVARALDVNIVIAKPNKEVGVSSFIEETYSLDVSGHMMTLYLPRDVIKKKDSVLVVDDVIKSGETQLALLKLVEKAKAEVSGVFAMISVGNAWKQKMNIPESCQVEVILEI
jgi:adenine phosphoribosyltransferase